jgi:energy-coupling factor transporter ATP-binding protein EcfA2
MTTAGASDPIVAVERVGYTFAGSDRAALADISLTLAPGSLTVLAGQTGSGKSTLLRVLAGLIPGSASGRMAGRVQLFDLDTAGASSLDLATRAGLVLQSPDDQICTSDPVSEVAFGLENLCLPLPEIERRADHWLDRFALTAQRNQATNSLSGGQKQRLMLASILAMGPRLLLLDEPLAQLDAAGAAELLDELDGLRAAGLTVVVAEHRLDDLLRRADRLLILGDGRVVSDGPAKGPAAIEALGRANLRLPPLTPDESRGPSTTSTEPIARVHGLSFCWPRREQPLWSDVRFDIGAGECLALVGPNGSGKSTLLAALAGLVSPVRGRIEISDAVHGSTQIGLTPQNPDLTLFCGAVRDELAFGPRQLRLSAEETARRVAQMADALAIADLIDQPPLALSQGQRLRVAVAAALTLHPQLLLLDEPSTGQDPQQVCRLLSAVRELLAAGEIGAVLFSTHDPRLVERYATRVLVIAEEKLLADCSPAALFADDALMARAGLRATSTRDRKAMIDAAQTARPTR